MSGDRGGLEPGVAGTMWWRAMCVREVNATLKHKVKAGLRRSTSESALSAMPPERSVNMDHGCIFHMLHEANRPKAPRQVKEAPPGQSDFASPWWQKGGDVDDLVESCVTATSLSMPSVVHGRASGVSATAPEARVRSRLAGSSPLQAAAESVLSTASMRATRDKAVGSRR